MWARACGSEGVVGSDLLKVDMDSLRGDFSCHGVPRQLNGGTVCPAFPVRILTRGALMNSAQR